MKVKSSILSMDEIVMLPSVGISDRHHLPDCPGLYFVISDGLVLYVGKAKSILSRWRSHHRERQIDGEYPNARIHWKRFDSSDFLLSVEAEYIRAINPRLNRTKVKKGRLCDSGFGPRIGLRFPAWHLNRLIVLSEVKMQSMAGLLQDTVQSWIEDNDVRLEGMIAELAMDDGITPDEWKDRALAKHEKKRNA